MAATYKNVRVRISKAGLEAHHKDPSEPFVLAYDHGMFRECEVLDNAGAPVARIVVVNKQAWLEIDNARLA